jgi:O-antigen/teichoic acid export membrane protein
MAIANAGWMMAGRLCADALSLVLFSIIAREYGPAGLGIYSAYFAIATILYDIVALGIDDFGVREYTVAKPAERPEVLQRLMRLQLMVATVALTAVTLFYALRSVDLQQLLIFAFLAIFQLSNALARTLLIPSMVEGSLARLTLASIASRLGIALVALAASLAPQPSLMLALSGFPVFGLAALAYAIFLHRHNFPAHGLFRPRGDEWTTLRTLLPFAAANVLSNVVVRIPMVVLLLASEEVAAGLYATAFKLAELGWVVLMSVPLASYAALMRAAQVDPDHLASQADHLLRQTLVLGGLIAWGLYAVAPAVVVPLLGAKVADARPLVAAMASFLVIKSISTYLLRLMLVFGRQGLWLRILATQVVVTLALTLLLAPRVGVLGTIAALVVGEVVTSVMHYLVVSERLKGSFLQRRIVAFLIVVGLSTCIAASIQQLTGWSLLAQAAALVTYVAGCAISGLLASDVFRKPVMPVA